MLVTQKYINKVDITINHKFLTLNTLKQNMDI